MSEPAPDLFRYRLAYSRGAELRYVGHLDTQLVWGRTFRRARLPLAFTQGFNPHPRFHMASALPLGCTSTAELIDIWLTEPIPQHDLATRINQATPPGLYVHEISEVGLSEPALQTLVNEARYTAGMAETPPGLDLPAAVSRVLAAVELPRERRGKAYDLRPLIRGVEVVSREPGRIAMRLSAREGATGRPDEVLAELGLDPALARIERTGLVLESKIPE